MSNFIVNIWDGIENFFNSLPVSVQTLVAKLKTDAGQMAQKLAASAATDIASGGVLNTASYVKAAQDIFSQLPNDAGILLTDVFAILNTEVSFVLEGQPTVTTSTTAS